MGAKGGKGKGYVVARIGESVASIALSFSLFPRIVNERCAAAQFSVAVATVWIDNVKERVVS